MLKGVTLQTLFSHKSTIRLLKLYQYLFALAIFCVTLFSLSFAHASDRGAERRAEITMERMLERQAMRAEALLQSRTETQTQRNSEIQLERSGLMLAERALEKQLAAKALNQDRLATSRRDFDRPTRSEPQEPSDPGNNDDPLDGDGLGSFDPGNQNEPDQKGNDEIADPEDIIEDALTDREISSEFSDLQFEQTMHSIQNDSSLLKAIDEQRVWTNEWVIMADAEAKSALEQEGYEFSNEEHLESFGSIIASVKAPATYDLHDDYQQVMEKLDKHDAVLDLNHIYSNIYTNATSTVGANSSGISPGDLLTLAGNGVRIGMVDTAINLEHRLLRNVPIEQQHFTQNDQPPVFTHGTAVASVLSGKGDGYQGILQHVELYNASVFVEAEGSNSITTALSLLRGLNWLVQQNIKVINMSLAGPPNRLLEKGIEQLCQRGIIIVAAAGNEGPFSKPMYPAGYSCAVAVTAVDLENKLYKKAVRGNHIDVAAYGVNILAANQDDSTTPQSGTSMAAPFVTAWIASQLPQQQNSDSWLDIALDSCIDLGEKGIDPLFGKGLLPFDALKLAAFNQSPSSEVVL